VASNQSTVNSVCNLTNLTVILDRIRYALPTVQYNLPIQIVYNAAAAATGPTLELCDSETELTALI
jgi:hypothetical protein